MRLTAMAHGGGCGCKLSPSVLQGILADIGPGVVPPELLVGSDTCDDAAVLRIGQDQAIVATTDFFMPIVDDPYDFGRIAATNALSDVYAMGGRPILALAVLGMPVGKISNDDIRRICAGGADVCARAGIPLAGGHSIDAPEPIYGLVGIGLVHPDRVLRNAGARAGDRLILTKPLGVGLYSAALRRDELPENAYAELIDVTTRLNAVGGGLAELGGVHAVTDVTGFGLFGHLLEMCRASQVSAEVTVASIPCLSLARDLAAQGRRTGASDRNWASYGQDVVDCASQEWRDILTDPQTSGGLLIAVEAGSADLVLSAVRAAGFEQAALIGEIQPGPGRIRVA